MRKFILDLFFPIHCLGCHREGEFICFSCLKQVPLNREQLTKFRQKSPLTGLITASDYDYPLVKQAIHRYKYDFIKELAKPLGKLMIKKLITWPKTVKKDTFLIPVPLHKKRLRWRGFNQAELLAKVVSQELRIPLINNFLVRTRYGLPQVQIKSPPERKANIKKAFEIGTVPAWQGLSLFNKTIILVDDISTTGATLKECAKTLKSLKPKEIWGLVVAKG